MIYDEEEARRTFKHVLRIINDVTREFKMEVGAAYMLEVACDEILLELSPNRVRTEKQIEIERWRGKYEEALLTISKLEQKVKDDVISK